MNMDMNTYTHTYKFRRDTTRRFSKTALYLPRFPLGLLFIYALLYA